MRQAFCRDRARQSFEGTFSEVHAGTPSKKNSAIAVGNTFIVATGAPLTVGRQRQSCRLRWLAVVDNETLDQIGIEYRHDDYRASSEVGQRGALPPLHVSLFVIAPPHN